MSIIPNIFTILFFLNYIPKIITVPKEDYKCEPPKHNLNVGDDVILCIHILKENKKLAMPIKVDEYSIVSFNHIFEIYNTLKNKNEIEFIAQIGDSITINPAVRINYINININIIAIL